MKLKRFGSGLKYGMAGFLLGVVGLACVAYSLHATDQRPFCATCHIMLPQAVSQKMSSHANISCNECHLPYNLLSKLPEKAAVGLHDIYANTFSDVILPVHATESMKDIVNTNCKRCHTMTNLNVASMASKRYCTDCHRNVPHQRTKPIGTRMVAYE